MLQDSQHLSQRIALWLPPAQSLAHLLQLHEHVGRALFLERTQTLALARRHAQLPVILNDTIEALLEELGTESLAPEPRPITPLQNALPEAKPAISVVVATTTCSRELLRTLELVNEAKEELVQRLGRATEIIVAVYGTETGESAALTGSGATTSIATGARDRASYSASLSNFATAEEFDAKIVSRNLPNCATAVNAAADIAKGKVLVLLKPELMPRRDCFCHILRATTNRRSLGGGTNVASEDNSLSSKLATMVLRLPLRLNGLSLGMTFVRKSAFQKLGGYRETMFSGETVEFALRLKKHAVSAGKQFSNIKAVCATRYRKGAFRLSLKECFMLLVLPLVWNTSSSTRSRVNSI